jgi:hypothetical protein
LTRDRRHRAGVGAAEARRAQVTNCKQKVKGCGRQPPEANQLGVEASMGRDAVSDCGVVSAARGTRVLVAFIGLGAVACVAE